MARITYITLAGDHIQAEATEGSLMTTALAHQVAGIIGECGGVCSCATCHVHIDPEWTERVGPAGDAEAAMLELDDHVADNSRLGCQVKISEDLDGLVVRVAGHG